ncbi:hypothetical protein Tco_0945551, partial [Tanacetum coccineum]
MVDFAPGRAVIDVAQRKRGKYMAKCAAIGYGFLLFSFSSLGELEADAITLLKRIRKFSMTQDIGARVVVHIFNRISFAIAKRMLGEYIASAPLTPLVKPGGGIRSIAVGTVRRRLVSKVSAIMIGHSLDGYLDGL